MNASRLYRHLFFDLDETLWDFRRNSLETLNDLIREHEVEKRGVPAMQFIERYHHHNTRNWSLFNQGSISREQLRLDRWTQTLLDFEIEDAALARRLSEQYLEVLPTKKHLFDDARHLLEYLKPRYALHIITNGFEVTQLKKIHTSGLSGFFTHIITSEKAGCLKPQPGIFTYAMDTAGATLEECLFIGDSPEADIAGARAVGMDYFWYNPEYVTPPFAITRVIHSLSELRNIL